MAKKPPNYMHHRAAPKRDPRWQGEHAAPVGGDRLDALIAGAEDWSTSPFATAVDSPNIGEFYLRIQAHYHAAGAETYFTNRVAAMRERGADDPYKIGAFKSLAAWFAARLDARRFAEQQTREVTTAAVIAALPPAPTPPEEDMSDATRVVFTIPERVEADIQCMSVIAQALEHFKMVPEQQIAVLDYLRSRIKPEA